jgi:hypothetical protein
MSFHGYRTVYSGDEGRISPDRPTAKTKRCHRNSESSRRRRYSSRESMSPRSDQFSDNESSHISISSYKSSSDSEDDSRSAYAGAKFNSPPPAYLLPNPPTSWISASSHQVEQVSLNAMSSHLRQILKVSV